MTERTRWTAIDAQATRKLYSRMGTVLGTVSYPAHWDEVIRNGRPVSFVADPAGRSPWDYLEYLHANQDLTFSYGTLEPCWRITGAVMLHGITPEQFEQVRGCSFAPGAGYLRSLLEGA